MNDSKRRHGLLGLAWCFGAALGMGLGSSAQAGDGVWVGEERGKGGAADGPATAHVVFDMRQGELVVSDGTGVWLGKARFEIAGAPTKGGDITYDADIVVASGATRLGQALPGYRKGRKILAKWRENSLTGDLSACLSLPGVKPTRPASASEVGKGLRCFELKRVVTWPAASAPDMGAPNFECLRECRAQSQMKAISPEAIEADCIEHCSGPR